MANETVVLLRTPEGRALVASFCETKNLKFVEFEALVKAQVTSNVNFRRRDLFAKFDDILDRIEIEEA